MCPKCDAATRVYDSRDKGGTQHRRRVCCDCGFRFTTFELYADEYAKLTHAKVTVRQVDKAKVRDIIQALKELVTS